jgi:hypothetical protein
LNVHRVNEVRQTELHTKKPLLPEPSAFHVELAIEELKRHKSRGIVQIPAELIKAEGRKIVIEIRRLISYFGIRRNSLRSGSGRSLYLSIRKATKQIVVIIGAYNVCQPRKPFI